MVADTEGRLYAATQFGVQVFSATGRLAGIVNFPDVAVSWNSKRPLSCVFGGENLSSLFVSCDDEVYAVSTRATGFQHPSPGEEQGGCGDLMKSIAGAL